jgi:hypothetical protein
MKPHEPKKIGIKQSRKRRGKTKDDKNKNQFDKRRKDNQMLSKKKAKRGGKKTLIEDNKKEGTEDQGYGT